MNNNRGNNRRRGRGNNRPQGGGQQLNRIDSRARGNAPQLLEKYRKLAQDAHLNGDRVQAEYYLQFADHYFRVIADSRVRQEEVRQRGNGSGERWAEPEADDDSAAFGMDADFPSFDRSPQRYERSEPRDYAPRENGNGNGERNERTDRTDRGERRDRDPVEAREPREPRRSRFEPLADDVLPEGARADEGEPVTDVSDNPFIRDTRQSRGLRPRGERRSRRDAGLADSAAGLDPSSLPPPIGARAEPAPELPIEAAPEPAPAPEQVAEEVAAPAPRKRGRPRKNPLPEPTAAEG